MGNAVPVEYLLLLLGSDAVVLVQEVQERTFGLLQGSICPRLEISQVGEDTLFEFLRVLHWTAEGLESEGEASNNVSTRYMKKVVPEYA